MTSVRPIGKEGCKKRGDRGRQAEAVLKVLAVPLSGSLSQRTVVCCAVVVLSPLDSLNFEASCFLRMKLTG